MIFLMINKMIFQYNLKKSNTNKLKEYKRKVK